MNLYQKLIEVRKQVPYLQKESKGYQFNYTGSSQVLAAVRQKLDELNILLKPEVISSNVLTETVEGTDKYDNPKKTTTYFTELNMKMTWINADNPEEREESSWYGQGVDIAGEKGVGKALTYAEKYFILKYFNIATDKDDPDSFQDKIDSYAPPKPKIDKQTVAAISSYAKHDEGLKKYVMSELKKMGYKTSKDLYKLTEEQGNSLLDDLAKQATETASSIEIDEKAIDNMPAPGK